MTCEADLEKRIEALYHEIGTISEEDILPRAVPTMPQLVFQTKDEQGNITDEGLSQMESYLQKFERLLHTADMTDPEVLDQVTGYNYHFHLILSNAAGNDYLNRLIQIMGSINNTIRHIYYFSDFSTDYEQSLTDHTDIYNAAKSRDPELAEKLTVTHIRRVGEVVLDKNGITPDE